MRRYRLLLLAAGLITVCSCSSYKQNVMFRPTEKFAAKRAGEAAAATKNYVIQANDYLKLEVYSNKGERIIDPNGELVNSTNGASQNSQTTRVQQTYLVTVDGSVKFPMIDSVEVAGLTIREAEQKLQAEYSKYYKECYVLLTFSNKRVIVLGSPTGQVIPLVNENVTVVEVLALARGIGNDGKANNIRLIRGNDVYMLDLSTLEGLKDANMIVQPGDIIYVEPIRRPFTEGARDLGPILSLTMSFLTLVVLFSTRN